MDEREEQGRNDYVTDGAGGPVHVQLPRRNGPHLRVEWAEKDLPINFEPPGSRRDLRPDEIPTATAVTRPPEMSGLLLAEQHRRLDALLGVSSVLAMHSQPDPVDMVNLAAWVMTGDDPWSTPHPLTTAEMHAVQGTDETVPEEPDGVHFSPDSARWQPSRGRHAGGSAE